MLSAAAATPASAQAANSEPGYCAQFYPNSDCNSVGPDTPGSNRQGDAVEDDPVEAAPVSPPVKPAKPRKQAHRSAFRHGRHQDAERRRRRQTAGRRPVITLV